MFLGLIKALHIITVICAVGAFIVQYLIVKKNLRSEDLSLRRASESIALESSRLLGQPGLILALITGIILVLLDPALLEFQIALHVKILLA